MATLEQQQAATIAVYTVQTDGGNLRGQWDSVEDAAAAVARRFGWAHPYLSIPFATVDADGVERTEWCVYGSEEDRDADQDGAYAPHIVRVQGR